MTNTLKISEIYFSIQGESTYVGLPCIFVRTSGCGLRCVWCDTKYSYAGGETLDFETILSRIAAYPARLVELTGGEPLEQPQSVLLMQELIHRGYQVLLETGGHIDISDVPNGVVRIVDMKPPGSRMADRNDYQNLERLRPGDEVKFVLMNRSDYDWSLDLIRRYDLQEKATILFSCAFGILAPAQVVDWMLADGIKARFQLQMHKYIWDPKARAV